MQANQLSLFDTFYQRNQLKAINNENDCFVSVERNGLDRQSNEINFNVESISSSVCLHDYIRRCKKKSSLTIKSKVSRHLALTSASNAQFDGINSMSTNEVSLDEMTNTRQ